MNAGSYININHLLAQTRMYGVRQNVNYFNFDYHDMTALHLLVDEAA